MMTRTTLIVALLLFAFAANSQVNWTQRMKWEFADADFAYYQGDLKYAFEMFQKLYKEDQNNKALNYRLGVCYLDLYNDKEKALSLLKSASNGEEVEALYHYGRALHAVEDFTEAIRFYDWYLQCGKREISDEEVYRRIRIAIRAEQMIEKPVDVLIQNVGSAVNSPYQEYVPVYNDLNGELWFTSRREDSFGGLKDPEGEFFEDIYVAKQADNGTWSEARNAGPGLNTGTHDATVSMSANGEKMLIYRTHRNLLGGDLYICERQGGTWSTPVLLDEQVNSNYQEACASLSADGNTIFFSSNRPGGYGGKDLYRVKLLPNGEWSLPKNLGPKINTQFDEDAPFIDVDGETLYFASKGHTTMGGYDIFRTTCSKQEREDWSLPENIGYPLNTVDDDIYLSVTDGGKRGFYSSDTNQGYGLMDIYEITFVYRNSYQVVCKGQVSDSQGNPVKARLLVTDLTTESSTNIYQCSSNGSFILVLHPMVNYRVIVEAEGYESVEDRINLTLPDNKFETINVSPYILTKGDH